MKPADYYAKLESLDFFVLHPGLVPFVGEDYDQYRILQIGESHYLNQREKDMRVHLEDFLEDWWTDSCPQLLAGSEGWLDTRGVVKRYFDGDLNDLSIFTNVLRSFCKIVLREEDPHIYLPERQKYNYFAFMNFFQMPSLLEGVEYWDSLYADNKDRAGEMWDVCRKQSSQIADEVIKILDPKMIVFTSISAGEAYCGEYRDDDRVVYTSHPQAPFTWNKGMKRFGSQDGKLRTGKDVFESALKAKYSKEL